MYLLPREAEGYQMKLKQPAQCANVRKQVSNMPRIRSYDIERKILGKC
jgi:hypothetical protein